MPKSPSRARNFLRARKSLRIALAGPLLGLFGVLAVGFSSVPTATAATSSYLNFQARLMTSAGSIVPDGNYNVEFKIYNASTSSGSAQGSCSGDSACQWVETRTGANQVRVADGYLTVNLGSVNAFPSTMPWDQQLWLTMNIGGTGTASWDGEMNPRIQLTAIPYAFKANAAAQIQNSAGSTLLTTSGNQVSLPNATGSSSALTFGGDTTADLYRTAAGTLKTDGSFDVAGALGIGVANPQGALSIANSAWINAVNAGGTGNVNILQVNSNNQIQLGAALAIDGGIVLPTDAGQVTFSDLPIDSSAAASTPESYTMRVGSTNALTVYGESDGAGGVQNVRIAIGSSITPGYTLDVGGDVNTSGVYRVGGLQICSSTGCTAASGSSYYIQNGTSQQPSSNFNISGSGTIGTTLTVTGNITGSGTISLTGTGASSLGGALGVGGTVTGSDLATANMHTYSLNRTLPTVVNNEVDIGSFAFTNGGGDLDVAITVPSSGFSDAKHYIIPVEYNQTSGNWRTVLPISDGGAYSSNDFALDINVSSGTASLRIRRTAGATAGTAYVYIQQSGIGTNTFTSSTATSSVSAPGSFYSGTSLSQIGNVVGVGLQPSSTGATLQVGGNITASSTIGFTNTGNANQAITLSEKVTSAVNAGDVVVIDTGNPGQVTDATTANSNQVFGIATTTNTAGVVQSIAVAGIYQVNVSGTVNPGNYLVTTTTAGVAAASLSPTGGVIGQALSTNSGGKAWVLIGPGSAGSNSLGTNGTTSVYETNVQNDATRATALQTGGQGDGKDPLDSSTGVWESTTNLNPNGGFESGVSGYSTDGSATLTQSTSLSKFGSSSMKMTVSGTPASAYSYVTAGIAVSPNTSYTSSMWVYPTYSGRTGQLVLSFRDSTLGTTYCNNSSGPINLQANVWQKLTYTSSCANASTAKVIPLLYMDNGNPVPAGEVMYVDGWQVEQKAFASPYVETNGSTASRNASRVTAPASLSNSTQGWFAARVRYGNTGTSYNGGLFQWGDGSNALSIYFDGTGWNVQQNVGGSSSLDGARIATAPNIGDYATVVGKWDSGYMYVSVNGSVFTKVSRSHGVPVINQTAFDIGSLASWFSGSQFDGDIMWTAAGTGTLADADAAALNAYGNSDPSLGGLSTLNAGASTPTMAWSAEDVYINQGGSGYQGGTGSYIQNTTSLQTGNINLQSGSTGSSAGIFRGATGQTANIFEIQDASANKLFTVDPTGNVSIAGNLSVAGNIGFSNTGNANQAFTINENITGSVTAGDVVVIDTSNAGYVKDATTANSTQVVGIATKTQTGGSEPIVISGIYQINVTGTVTVGDYLVTSSTAGTAQDTTSPSGGVIGQAMSTASSNKAWALIKPQSGAGGGSGSSGNNYGLMESDFTDTNAAIPGAYSTGKIATVGNNIYMFGGFTGSGDKTIYYTPVNNPTHWQTTGKTLPDYLRNSSLAIIGSQIYLFGGYSDTNSGLSTAIYTANVSDPTTWTNAGGAAPGVYNSSLAVIGSYIYMYGGTNGSAAVQDIYRASTSNPTSWTDLGTLLPSTPGAIQEAAVAVIGNYVYLFGGYGSTGLNNILRAPISSPTSFTNMAATLPTADYGGAPGLTIIGNYVYIFGGYDNTNYINTIYRAPLSDPVYGWSKITNSSGNGTLPSKMYMGGSYIAGNALYLIPGYNGTAYSGEIYSAPIYNGSPDVSSNPSWITDSNYSSGGGSGTSSQTANNNYELAYNELNTGSVSITAIAEASANNILTSSSITADGNTKIRIEFYGAIGWLNNANYLRFYLYQDSSDLGEVGEMYRSSTTSFEMPVNLSREFIPSAGAHTYSIRATVDTGTGVVYGNTGGASTGVPLPSYIRVTLANPQLQGGAGIQNGTTVQTGNFNLQSSSQTSVTGILKGATSQSADVFEVQDASNNILFNVGPTGNVSIAGNLSVAGNIGFSNTGNANQAFTINENITGSVTAGDVVVIDTSNAGYVKDATTANSTQVVGIATKTQTGGSEPIVISGIYQVNVGSNTPSIGDYLVTDGTNSGEATGTSSPSGGVIGQAMSTATSNKVWALIKPQSGAGGGSGSGSNSYGLMESDFTDTTAHLPTNLFVSSTVTIGNTIYAFGGQYGSSPSWSYSNHVYTAPVSNPTNWTDRGAANIPQGGYSSVAIIGSYVYLFGGSNGTSVYDNIYRAPVSDPIGSWVSAGHLYAALGSSSLAIIGNTIYLFGGATSTSADTNHIYTASTSDPLTWSQSSNTLPYTNGIAGASTAVIGNYVYLFGGADPSGQFNTIARAKTSSPSVWTKLSSGTSNILPGNVEFGRLAIIGNSIYLFGAQYESTTPTIKGIIYKAPISNPVTGWADTKSTLPADIDAGMVYIAGNAVYYAGGYIATAGIDNIYSAPIYNGGPDISSNPSWLVDSNYSAGGGSGTSSQTTNGNYELAYSEFNTNNSYVYVTATSASSGPTVVQSPSFTTANATSVNVSFYAPAWESPAASGDYLMADLFEDSTDLGYIALNWQNGAAGTALETAVNGSREILVSPGSHTFTVKAFVNGGTGGYASGPGGAGAWVPGYIRVTLANPYLQGGSGIANGTTTQTANFNVQSSSASNVTAVIQGATSQSADILEVKDASNTNLLAVDPNGNLSVKGNIGFSNTGNANQALTLNEVVTSAVTAGDVVVIDTANAGQVTDSTTINSTKVFGIATQTKSAGQSQPIVISGIYQVNVGTNTVNVGDYLVTSNTTGQAQTSSSPTGGIVGQALSTASSNKVWALIKPASGAGGGGGGGMTKLYDITLGANASNFDITNLPSGYDSLKIVSTLRTDGSVGWNNALVRFNGDSSANYNRGATGGTGSATYGFIGGETDSAAPSGAFGAGDSTIPNYTNTTVNKTMVSSYTALNSTSGDVYSGTTGTRWASTAAINEITIYPNSGSNFVPGSRVIVYGVGGSSSSSSGYSGGSELAYNTFTGPISVTHNTDAAADTIVTANQITSDGSPLLVNFYSPWVTNPTSQEYTEFDLFIDGSPSGQVTRQVYATGSGNQSGTPVNLEWRITPSVGTHTYSIRAFTGTPSTSVNGGGSYAPGFVRITLANPGLQGGAGIQNGTTLQTGANFNIMSVSPSSVTATIHGTSGQSADILDVQNSSNINLLSVDPNGNTFVAGDLNVGGTIGFSNIGNQNQGISLNMVVSSSVTAGDVVVIDTTTAGNVTDSTTANSTKVFGIATQTNATTGLSQPIIVSGIYQVNVDTAQVNIGDYLVTSSTTGKATDSTSPNGGVIGQALSYKAAGSSGTVWARINPGNGVGGSGSGGAGYGLMESDWTDTLATLPSGGLLESSQTATIGNNIYLFGGDNGTNIVSTIYSAPVSNPTNFTAVGNLPSPIEAGQVAVIGSYVYYFGGWASGGAQNTIFRAPLSSPTSWTNLTSTLGVTIPTTLQASQLAIIGNYVYLFGGNTGASSSTSTNNIYRASLSDPTNWGSAAVGTISPATGGLYYSQTAIIGNYVYLFGGNNTTGSNTAAIYRAPISNPLSWSSAGSMSGGALDASELAIIGNYVYLFGGNNGSGWVNSIFRASINNPTSWSTLNVTLPVTPGIGFSSTYIAGSAIYLVGGANGSAVKGNIYSAPIYNGGPDLSSNPSWKVDSNASSGGGSGTSSQTANTNTELAYTPITSDVTVSSTTLAGANTVASATITADGTTSYQLNFFSPGILSNGGTAVNLLLYDGSTYLGIISTTNESSASVITPADINYRLVSPSAGSHTYTVKAYLTYSGTAYNGTIHAGGSYVNAYLRITLANPQIQGGSGINNGTTTQTANFSIQSANANNPTAVIQGAASQSADILDVRNGSGSNLLNVDASGNLGVTGAIGFNNSGNASQIFTVNEKVTTTVNQYDVVVIDTNNAGQVTTTTLANSTKVFGVATQTKGTAGQTEPIAISGIYQVNVDTAAVNIGDYLVTSGTAGLATDSAYPGGGVIGQAMSAKTAGSNGTVWVRLNPGNGAGGSGSGANYGLMEADWTQTGTLPNAVGRAQIATIGNYIYMFGGNNSSGTVISNIYQAPVSNPNSWSDTGWTLPGPLEDSQVAIIGSTVYLFGGNNGTSPVRTVYSAPISNLSTASWTTTANVLPAALSQASLAIIGSNIYLYAGTANGSAAAGVIYTASVSSPLVWSNAGGTNIPGVYNSQLAVVGNNVYLFGGNGGGPVQTVYRAPISSPTSFTSFASTLPSFGLQYSQLAIVGNYIYLIGGDDGTSVYRLMERAPVSNPLSWSFVTVGNTYNQTLPAQREAGMTAIVGNALYYFGGSTGTAEQTTIYSTPIVNGGPDLSSNPSWKVDSNASSGGGSGTSSQTANGNYQLDYQQIISNASVSASVEGSANTVITGNSVTYDGSKVKIQAFIPGMREVTGNPYLVHLVFTRDGSPIGQVKSLILNSSDFDGQSIDASLYDTPSAGSHTYGISAFIDGGGSINMLAGPGGAGQVVPAFLSVTRANPSLQGGVAGIQNSTLVQTGNINLQSSSQNNPTIVISGATSQSADILDVKNSSGSLLFNVSATGTVGINQASPQAALDVNNTVRISSGGNSYIKMYGGSDGSNSSSIYLYNPAGSLGTQITDGTYTSTIGGALTVSGNLTLNGYLITGSSMFTTTMPSSPVNGQEVYFIADATHHIVWHLRYNSAVPEWEYLGGAPLENVVSAQETIPAANTWSDLTTVGPSVTIPRSGNYLVQASVNGYGGSSAGNLYIAFTDGSNTQQGGNVAYYIPVAGARTTIVSNQILSLTAGQTLKLRYYSDQTGAKYDTRTLIVTPIAVN